MCNFIRAHKAEKYISVSLNTSDEELTERVNSLSDDEAQVYKWLREYYSESWIAETLFIGKSRLKELKKSLCIKLGVSGVRTMLRIYGHLGIPKVKEPVSTKEIDSYVEARTEREIQKQLKGK